MGDNWGASEFKNDNLGIEAPKFKSVQPPSLPISPSPVSPSSYLAALSPTQFLLNSPLFVSSPNVSLLPLFSFLLFIIFTFDITCFQ